MFQEYLRSSPKVRLVAPVISEVKDLVLGKSKPLEIDMTIQNWRQIPKNFISKKQEPRPALTFVSAASAPACSITYAITAQSLTGELKWIAAGRIATDESRSAADSLAVGSVPQDSATGTRSEESTAAISTHLYEF